MTDDDVHPGYVSLFSGGGFGDLGIVHGVGIPLLACCELVEERADVLRRLFPFSSVHCGDIWTVGPDIVRVVREKIGEGRRPWLLVMSPPCQGMSSNGKGRIGVGVERGTRPSDDPRNRLVLPALEVIDALQPEWVIVENVKHMQRTLVPNELGQMENLIDLLRRRLSQYTVEPRVVEAADYGVPQGRERLITVCSRSRAARPYHAPPTHGNPPLKPHVSIRMATLHLSPLDAMHCTSDTNDLLHCIPGWTSDQYFCMSHTPEGCTAFENAACVECGRDQAGTKNVDCEWCGKALPRPVMCESVWECDKCGALTRKGRATCDGGHFRSPEAQEMPRRRIVRAFKTSYRRMRGDRPASTLTTNSGVISSDVKGHPYENRVLSVREVLIVASLTSYPGESAPWKSAEDVLATLPHRLIRTIAGESIPPRMFAAIVSYILRKDRLAPTATETKP